MRLSKRDHIPHSRPQLGRAELRAVARVLRSGHLASGREVQSLEEELAERLGARHAIACSSGTAALHLALTALGLGPGARVLAPSYVCVAVLNALRYTGAREDLCDLEPRGFNLDANEAVAKARGAQAAIVPHLFGYPAEARRLARTGIPVIEDCAMSIGATDDRGRPLGSSGAAAIYSFYATKLVAGGEGGLVTTADEALAREIRDLRSYDKKDDWKVRFNYKLTDVQAALVRAQARRLPRALARRQAIARLYRAALDPERLILPPERSGATYFRFVVRSRVPFDEVARRFAGAGIDVARPVHRPLHRCLGVAAAAFPRTEEVYLTAFSLPIYATLTSRNVKRIAAIANQL